MAAGARPPGPGRYGAAVLPVMGRECGVLRLELQSGIAARC